MKNEKEGKVKSMKDSDESRKIKSMQNAEHFLFEAEWPEGVDPGEKDIQCLEFLRTYLDYKVSETEGTLINGVLKGNQESKNLINLQLEFDNHSEHIEKLNEALTHVLEMAGGFDEDRLTSNDMFWFAQLLKATMKNAWTVSDLQDPFAIKTQPKRRA